MKVCFKGSKTWYKEMLFHLNKYKIKMYHNKCDNPDVIIWQPHPRFQGYIRDVPSNNIKKVKTNADIVKLFEEEL